MKKFQNIKVIEKVSIPGLLEHCRRVVLWVNTDVIISTPKRGIFVTSFLDNAELIGSSTSRATNYYHTNCPLLLMAQWNDGDGKAHLRHIRQAVPCAYENAELYSWDYIKDQEARKFCQTSQVKQQAIPGGLDKYPPFHLPDEVAIADFRISGTWYYLV